ncbi:MAG: tyrosine-type recombinase/integrase [Nannocystaceae bacterium]
MAVRKVRRRGRSVYRARRHYVCPKTGKEKSKTRYCDTKAEALDADYAVRDEIKALQERFGVHGRGELPTLDALWNDAIQAAIKSGRDRSTIYNKEKARNRISPAVLKLRVDRLTDRVLDHERARLLDTCRSWGTARITVDEIRALLKLAVRWGYITSAPDLRRITANEVGVLVDDEAKSLTASEAKALLAALQRQRRPVHHGMASVQLYAGVRVGMAMGLHESEIDFEGGMLTFAHQWNDDEQALGPPKGRKTHRVPLLPELATILSRYPRESPGHPLVFASGKTGKPIRRISYNKQLRRAAEAAGIPEPKRVTSHMLRHTAGTLIGEVTGSELAVMHFLGHSDTRVSRRYIHGKRRHVNSAAEALQEALNRDHDRDHSGAVH